MRHSKAISCVACVFLLACSSVHSQASASSAWTTIRFHGIRATDPDGRIGLRNPERGLRYESRIGNALGNSSNRMDWIRVMQRFAPDGMTLSQTYCYLDDFVDGPTSTTYTANLLNVRSSNTSAIIWATLGLWLPDPKPTIRLDPQFAVRLANRETPWWTNTDGQYGVNTLHAIQVAKNP